MPSIGIQSYTFHESRDLDVLCRSVRDCGCQALGLSNFHVDWRGDAEATRAALEKVKGHGLEILSIGPVTDPADERVFEAARAAGTRVVAASFTVGADFLERMNRAAELAARHDCVVAIHNHGGYDWLGHYATLDYAFANTPANFGLCLDTAWAMDAAAGEKNTPEAWVRRYGARLFNMHLKDFSFNPDRSRREWIIGDGNLKLDALFAACAEVGYAGDYLVEYEADAKTDPKAFSDAVAQGVERARMALAAVAPRG